MDKKLSIDVDVTKKYSLSGPTGIPMDASDVQISSLDELKNGLSELRQLIDDLLNQRDIKITGTIKGYLIIDIQKGEQGGGEERR